MKTWRFAERVKSASRSLMMAGASKWIFYGVIIGVLTGFMGLLYTWTMDVVTWLLSGKLIGFYLPESGPGAQETVRVGVRWALLLLPAAGGLVVGLMHKAYTSNLLGVTEGYISFFHTRRALMSPVKGLWRLMSSVITISTGGSAGKEGPVIFAASSLGSFIAKILRLSDRDRGILTVCGAGGGLGAIFRAPVGGALYAAEVLYRKADFEADAVMPAIVTSVTAYAVYGFFGNWTPLFSTPHYHFRITDLPFFALLGLMAPGLSWVYAQSLRLSQKAFRFVRLPSWTKPAIGGLLVGAILVFMPQVAGPGYGVLQLAIHGKMLVWTMLVIAVVKMLATSFTVGSGGSGGIFAPTLVIGGMVGGALGWGLSALGAPVQAEAYVLVGMGAFLSAAANVPLSSIILICEMVGNYELLVPMTLASSLAFLISRRYSIYPTQVDTRWDSPLHKGEFAVDIMEDIPVKQTMCPASEVPHFSVSTPLKQALHQAAESDHDCFPVVDEDQNLLGVLYTEDLRHVLFHGEMEDMEDLLVVEDVMRATPASLEPEQNLHQAMEMFLRSEMDELPVVKNGKFVGVLTKKDLIRAYQQELLKRKNHG